MSIFKFLDWGRRGASEKTLRASVKAVGAAWEDSLYYADAENWTRLFWGEATPFSRLFAELNLSNVIDLACGHGRHAEIVAQKAAALTLMDIHEANLEVCRKRLANAANVSFVLNSGFDFRPLRDASTTAIYCYDAMVHFSPDVVSSYLNDTARVLAPGGRALYHHSNYPAPPDRAYSHNPHARNHMTKGLFADLSRKAELTVLHAEPMDWGHEKELDCLTLVERPL